MALRKACGVVCAAGGGLSTLVRYALLRAGFLDGNTDCAGCASKSEGYARGTASGTATPPVRSVRMPWHRVVTMFS